MPINIHKMFTTHSTLQHEPEAIQFILHLSRFRVDRGHIFTLDQKITNHPMDVPRFHQMIYFSIIISVHIANFAHMISLVSTLRWVSTITFVFFYSFTYLTENFMQHLKAIPVPLSPYALIQNEDLEFMIECKKYKYMIQRVLNDTQRVPLTIEANWNLSKPANLLQNILYNIYISNSFGRIK